MFFEVSGLIEPCKWQTRGPARRRGAEHPVSVVGGRGMPWENLALYLVLYLGLFILDFILDFISGGPLARAGEDNEPDKVQDKDTDIAMAQSRFVLDFIRYFVFPAPPAGLRDKAR